MIRSVTCDSRHLAAFEITCGIFHHHWCAILSKAVSPECLSYDRDNKNSKSEVNPSPRFSSGDSALRFVPSGLLILNRLAGEMVEDE